MKRCKALSAGILAAAMLFGMTGCYGDTTWVMETETDTVPAGVYLTYMIGAYSEAQDSIDSTQDMWEQSIDGVSVEQWIINEAVSRSKEYIAVNLLFDELGMTLSEEDNESIKNQANNYWTNNQEFYEKNGISFASVKKLTENTYKTNLIFDYYYDEGGPEEVSEGTLKEYFYDNYAKIKYMTFLKQDPETGEDKSDEDLKEEVESYITKLNKGEDFDSIIDAYIPVIWEQMGITNTYTPDTSDANRNVTLLNKNNTGTYMDHFIETTFEQTQYGVPYTDYEGETYAYLAIRYDLTADEELFEENRSSLLREVCADSFEQKLDEAVSGIVITTNESAVNRYSPKNIQMS